MVTRLSGGTREAILEAAYRCIARQGYGAVSMRQIAREAGVALSQLHYYFRAKEYLLVEVLRRTMEQHVQETVSWLAGLPEDRRLFGLFSMLRTKLRQDPGGLRLLFDCLSVASRDPEARRQVRRVFRELSDEAARRLPELWESSRHAAAAGSGVPWQWLSRLSPATLGRVVVGALYGIALQLLVEGEEENHGPAWFEELVAAVSPQ